MQSARAKRAIETENQSRCTERMHMVKAVATILPPPTLQAEPVVIVTQSAPPPRRSSRVEADAAGAKAPQR